MCTPRASVNPLKYKASGRARPGTAVAGWDGDVPVLASGDMQRDLFKSKIHRIRELR